jgi:hypothetical protein
MLDMDDKAGWPAAFSIKFGNGSLSVYPNCVDVGTIVSPYECSLRGVRNGDDEKQITAMTEDDEKPSANADITLVEISDSILDSSKIDTTAPEFKIKVNCNDNKSGDLESEHKVSGAVFLKFLIIWYASMSENGIAFLPGSLKRFDDKKVKMRDSGYELAMMKPKGKKKVESLPCGSLFYDGNPANIQSDVMDTICKVLFDVTCLNKTSSSLESGKAAQLIKSRKLVLDAVLGRKINDRKDAPDNIPVKLNDDRPLVFSYEKLNGVRVIIKKSLFNKLSKLTLGDKIRGNAKFNKDKDVFFKKLARFIEQK